MYQWIFLYVCILSLGMSNVAWHSKTVSDSTNKAKLKLFFCDAAAFTKKDKHNSREEIHLKTYDDPKNENNPKNKDDPKNGLNPKNEDDLNNEDDPKMKTTQTS